MAEIRQRNDHRTDGVGGARVVLSRFATALMRDEIKPRVTYGGLFPMSAISSCIPRSVASFFEVVWLFR